MRVVFLALMLTVGLGKISSDAQEKVVQTFSGSSLLTTESFQVQDKWEVRWEGPDALTITVCFSPDNKIVTTAAGSSKGSLYQSKGGTFYLKVKPASAAGTSPWQVSVVEIGSPMESNQANPGIAPQPPPSVMSPVVSTNSVGAVTSPLTTTNATETATPPVPASSSSGGLTDDQAHAVVVIKGDVAEGTGFLVKTDSGPAVVTNIHVISANPNLRILTTTGVEIKVLALKGASDRDLAMFSIQDNHYSYLDLNEDIKDTVENGDEVITPGNSEGGEVVLDTKGKVLGIGPDSIEFDNPIYHGNSGGPVFHTKSGKVVAVVTQAKKVNISNDVDKASFDSKNSAITGTMRYFGLRLDTVPTWETYDWNRFLNETEFLKNFHEESRALDSYLNGARYERAGIAGTDESGAPNAQYYLRNEKIETAQENYQRFADGADSSQRLDAVRELVVDLEGIADTDMAAIQSPGNFYSFDQLRTKQEIEYRKALRTEIENMENKISDMGH